MSDTDKIKPNFEPENKSVPKNVDNKKNYDRVVPSMVELIKKNKEEIEKASKNISSSVNTNVCK